MDKLGTPFEDYGIVSQPWPMPHPESPYRGTPWASRTFATDRARGATCSRKTAQNDLQARGAVRRRDSQQTAQSLTGHSLPAPFPGSCPCVNKAGSILAKCAVCGRGKRYTTRGLGVGLAVARFSDLDDDGAEQRRRSWTREGSCRGGEVQNNGCRCFVGPRLLLFFMRNRNSSRSQRAPSQPFPPEMQRALIGRPSTYTRLAPPSFCCVQDYHRQSSNAHTRTRTCFSRTTCRPSLHLLHLCPLSATAHTSPAYPPWPDSCGKRRRPPSFKVARQRVSHRCCTCRPPSDPQ